MANGTIKTVTDRGFGFIRPDTGGEDVFVHQSGLVGVDFAQLRQGDRVPYTAGKTPGAKARGPKMCAVWRSKRTASTQLLQA